VTKGNAGKKKKLGGWADAELASGQNSDVGLALPPDKGSGEVVMKDNAGKKKKPGLRGR
jgi:hypothetical protein